MLLEDIKVGQLVGYVPDTGSSYHQGEPVITKVVKITAKGQVVVADGKRFYPPHYPPYYIGLMSYEQVADKVEARARQMVRDRLRNTMHSQLELASKLVYRGGIPSATRLELIQHLQAVITCLQG